MLSVRADVSRQNEIIDKISQEIKATQDPDKLETLRSKLEIEKLRLRNKIQMAMLEQRRNKDERWDPIQITTVAEDL
jgi:hypothetical protein